MFSLHFANVSYIVVKASRRCCLDSGPRGGWHVVYRHRRYPRLPHHGPPEEEVRGQVQASLAGVDVSAAAAGQPDQASSRGEVDLKSDL